MKCNVYIKDRDGFIRMEQCEGESISMITEIVAMNLEGEEIVFVEDKNKPQIHTFNR